MNVNIEDVSEDNLKMFLQGIADEAKELGLPLEKLCKCLNAELDRQGVYRLEMHYTELDKWAYCQRT